MTARPRVRTILIYVALVGIAAIQVLPLLFALTTSLKTLDDAYVFPPSLTVVDPQWGNYLDAFAKLPFGRFMLNSIVITLAAVTGAVVSSSMAGYALARLPWRGKRFWFVLLLGSMMLPSQVC